ncbi:MAG: Threonine--tRNA ligase 2 [Chlamydiia bacterium]|nr:Threonine--tRNA ligase 2 [Chlamydiia bacterium]MCH9616361.1 Threonine--tRNA ligase 2 [Chlamydiia bacterium]MCH9629653.1 Threonine--tRNA ligase 2 [Chlamydiia bacterium]
MNIKFQESDVEIEEGASGKDLADKLNMRDPHQALAVSINGKTVDLNEKLSSGDHVDLVNFDEKEGKEIFWHTSAHILAQAVLRLYPDAKPTIGPPIENGFYYDFANLEISIDDFPKIEKEMQKIIKENHRPERSTFPTKQDAVTTFSDNPYKKELIEGFDDDGVFSAYKQGEFFDLCRGPHLPSLGKVKAIKLLKTSGAYWRGDSDREMLTRIYGISFPDKQQMKDYLHMLEEAKKRDHRLVGTALDLYSFREEAPGMPFLHPKGMIIWNTLFDFWRDLHTKAGYVEIKTPQIMSQELWEKSGHWEHYRENMFSFEIEDRHFAIKPMSCPGGMLYYKSHIHSYREFPLRVGEIGHVYRYEPSGALNGLFRVRSFHQDDAHIFMTEEQICDEIVEILRLTEELYAPFGLSYHLELSTRPEESIGTDKDWEMTTKGLQDALDKWDKPYVINEGDGAFYGPKIDVHIKDALGRSWQCGTVQLDMSLPERFDLTYRAADGTSKRPIMIHRALFGSFERFLGILVEHYAGKFPLWISPLQVRVVPVADRHAEYGHKVVKQLQDLGFTCDIDDTGESVSKKIRKAQLLKINYMLTVGDQEVENQTISVRSRDNVVRGESELKAFIEELTHEKNSRQ